MGAATTQLRILPHELCDGCNQPKDKEAVRDLFLQVMDEVSKLRTTVAEVQTTAARMEEQIKELKQDNRDDRNAIATAKVIRVVAIALGATTLGPAILACATWLMSWLRKGH